MSIPREAYHANMHLPLMLKSINPLNTSCFKKVKSHEKNVLDYSGFLKITRP